MTESTIVAPSPKAGSQLIMKVVSPEMVTFNPGLVLSLATRPIPLSIETGPQKSDVHVRFVCAPLSTVQGPSVAIPSVLVHFKSTTRAPEGTFIITVSPAGPLGPAHANV